jgi:pyruvate dehydrogenase (quinone)
MAKTVADVLWEMLERAGVKRRYGIVGDTLNPVIQALHRNANIEFIHVRHEEDGVFAAVAEASLTSNAVSVCGTAARASPSDQGTYGHRCPDACDTGLV